MMNFPDAPTPGQSFPPYTWDGVKWTMPQMPTSVGDYASDLDPLVNGVMLPGLTTAYARADHVHPSDASRLRQIDSPTVTGTTSAVTVNITGNVPITGTFYSSANGHYLGAPTGNTSPPLKSEANIVLYDGGGDNWAGIGCDVGGNVWIRTGISGTPGPALFIDQGRTATFLKTPYAPTPASSDSSTKFATTAFVAANPASGPYLPLSGGTVTSGIMYINGDLRTYRADSVAQGVLFLNSAGTRYMHYTGNDNYHLVSAHCYSAAGRLWGNSDFGWPISNVRLAFGADQTLAQSAALTESYGASGYVVTGSSGPSTAGSTMRYRQFQILTNTWYAVGTA